MIIRFVSSDHKWRLLKMAFLGLFWALCVFPVAAEISSEGIFNVRSFGAVGDGRNLDSPAINKTIEAAAAAGGGTVLLPAGTYLSGSIQLESNIHLLIDAGATILGAPQNMQAYDRKRTLSARRFRTEVTPIFTTVCCGAKSSQTYSSRVTARSTAGDW